MPSTSIQPEDYFRCHRCGRLTHIDLLDGKDDGSGDFNTFECRPCYGPGWLPAFWDRAPLWWRALRRIERLLGLPTRRPLF